MDTKNIKPDFVMDLRGVECPLNFVKTKIKLYSMAKDEILEVLLDPGESVQSVSESVIQDGHNILFQAQISNYYKLSIQKY